MFSTLLAGIFMLPPALVLVGTFPLVALLSLPGLALLCYSRPKQNTTSTTSPTTTSLPTRKKRAIVTGGSSGIGLCVAQECLQQGFDEIILIARNVEKLNQAKEELKKQLQQQTNETKETRPIRIEALSVDVSNETELEKAASQIFGDDNKKKKEDATTKDVFTCLFCVAGITQPDYFENLDAATLTRLVHTNQLGTMQTVAAFLPHMTTGTIVLTSSMAGLVGTFGYTGYAPTKFALKGFAEALHMELVARPISICLAYPPDTDTPGLELENVTKPPETHLISEAGGLAQPEAVAHIMVKEAGKTNPNFAIYFNFDGWMLCALTCGFSPVTSVWEAVSQVAGMGLFRIIALFYLHTWTAMIRSHAKAKQQTKETNKQEEKASVKKTKQDAVSTRKNNSTAK